MAYAARIQSKGDLKSYILRQLGSPVVNIEITDDQMDDAIDNGLELYMQNAYSGVIERFVPLEIVAGQVDYIMPYEMFAITTIRTQEMGGITNSAPSNMFSMNQFIASDLYRGSGKIDLLTYEMTNQLLSTLDIMFSKKVTWDFNCISKKLHLFEIPIMSETAMVQCYLKAVPDYISTGVSGQPDIEVTNIYNELWVRRYTVELARRQWADNLTKYEGSQLPNGMVMNASAILTRADAEITKLEEMLYNTLSVPSDFFIG
jgi:hypothetical protein